MPEFLNKKYLKLTLWQWGIIVIAAIFILFNLNSVLKALANIFLVVALGCVALGIISWLTHRPKMATRFGIFAAIAFLLMYIVNILNGG